MSSKCKLALQKFLKCRMGDGAAYDGSAEKGVDPNAHSDSSLRSDRRDRRLRHCRSPRGGHGNSVCAGRGRERVRHWRVRRAHRQPDHAAHGRGPHGRSVHHHPARSSLRVGSLGLAFLVAVLLAFVMAGSTAPEAKALTISPSPIQPYDLPEHAGDLVKLLQKTKYEQYWARLAAASEGSEAAIAADGMGLVAEDAAVGLAPEMGLMVPAIGLGAAVLGTAVVVDIATGGAVHKWLFSIGSGGEPVAPWEVDDYPNVVSANLHFISHAAGYRLEVDTSVFHNYPFDRHMYDVITAFGYPPPDPCTVDYVPAFSYTVSGCDGRRANLAYASQAWGTQQEMDADFETGMHLHRAPDYECFFQPYSTTPFNFNLALHTCGDYYATEADVRGKVKIKATPYTGQDHDREVGFTPNGTPDLTRLRYKIGLADDETKNAINHALEPSNTRFHDPSTVGSSDPVIPDCYSLTVAACRTALNAELASSGTNADEYDAPQIDYDPTLEVGKVVFTDPYQTEPFPGTGVHVKIYVNPDPDNPPVASPMTWYYNGEYQTLTPGKIKILVPDSSPALDYSIWCNIGDPYDGTIYGTFGLANLQSTSLNQPFYPGTGTDLVLEQSPIIASDLGISLGDPFYCIEVEKPHGSTSTSLPTAAHLPHTFHIGDAEGIDPGEPGTPGVGGGDAGGGGFVPPGGDCICPTATIDFSPLQTLNFGDKIPFGVFGYIHGIINPLVATPERPALNIPLHFALSGNVGGSQTEKTFAIDIPSTWDENIDDWFSQARHWESLLFWVGAWWWLLRQWLKITHPDINDWDWEGSHMEALRAERPSRIVEGHERL